MKVQLTDDEALVLFEWLARHDEENVLVADPVEERVLWAIQGQLEKQLVEPFEEDYLERVGAARARILSGSQPTTNSE
jgi:hypothetical protein